MVSLELPRLIRSQSGLLALDRRTLVFCIGFCDHRSVAKVVATCWQARAHFPASAAVRAQAFYLHRGAPARFVNSQLPTAPSLIRTEMEQMTKAERGKAVVAAAGSSDPASLDIINALLDGKDISEDHRGLAVGAAAGSSGPTSLAIINALLKGKNISDFHRGLAVVAAKSSSPASPAIIEALLDGKDISEDHRGMAVAVAAGSSGPASLAIINALLKVRTFQNTLEALLWRQLQEVAALQASISSKLSCKVRIFQTNTEAWLYGRLHEAAALQGSLSSTLSNASRCQDAKSYRSIIKSTTKGCHGVCQELP